MSKESDPQIRNAIPLPKSMWDKIVAFQERESISSKAEALRRVVFAGLRVLGMEKAP